MAKLVQKRRPALAFRAKDLKYCIFGLGDSHYWGKGTEDGVNLSTSLKDTLWRRLWRCSRHPSDPWSQRRNPNSISPSQPVIWTTCWRRWEPSAWCPLDSEMTRTGLRFFAGAEGVLRCGTGRGPVSHGICRVERPALFTTWCRQGETCEWLIGYSSAESIEPVGMSSLNCNALPWLWVCFNASRFF